jgi:hypothetical protein
LLLVTVILDRFFDKGEIRLVTGGEQTQQAIIGRGEVLWSGVRRTIRYAVPFFHGEHGFPIGAEHHRPVDFLKQRMLEEFEQLEFLRLGISGETQVKDQNGNTVLSNQGEEDHFFVIPFTDNKAAAVERPYPGAGKYCLSSEYPIFLRRSALLRSIQSIGGKAAAGHVQVPGDQTGFAGLIRMPIAGHMGDGLAAEQIDSYVGQG